MRALELKRAITMLIKGLDAAEQLQRCSRVCTHQPGWWRSARCETGNADGLQQQVGGDGSRSAGLINNWSTYRMYAMTPMDQQSTALL